MRVPEVLGDEAVREPRRDQRRVELSEAPDVLAVMSRHERVRPRDLDREPFVVQLVRHRVPVDDLRGDHREDRREGDPEHDDAELDAEGG